jgi:hypothetical protein
MSSGVRKNSMGTVLDEDGALSSADAGNLARLGRVVRKGWCRKRQEKARSQAGSGGHVKGTGFHPKAKKGDCFKTQLS